MIQHFYHCFPVCLPMLHVTYIYNLQNKVLFAILSNFIVTLTFILFILITTVH